jgi:hypothetical protein
MTLDLPAHNLRLINFNQLLIEDFQIGILNHLHTFKLLDKPLTNLDVKKIMYHNLIHGMCESYKNSCCNRPVYIFNDTQLDDCLLKDHYKEEDLLAFFNSFFTKFEKMLPIPVIKSWFNTYSLNYMIGNNDARAVLAINGCTSKLTEIKSKEYTFQRIKRFSKKYDLTFLSNEYFNSIKTKQILI